MSFLDLENKTFLVVGVANRKSVAWSVAKLLKSEGANILYCVRSAKRRDELSELLGKSEKIFTCDFEKESEISELEKILAAQENLKLDGILHSIAFANYSEGVRPFHETKRRTFYKLRKYHLSPWLNYQEFVNHF